METFVTHLSAEAQRREPPPWQRCVRPPPLALAPASSSFACDPPHPLVAGMLTC